MPASARTNVFVLGWLAALVVTGEWPYAARLSDAAGGEKAARELLAPLVLGGKVQVTLPEALKGVEPILKRALSPAPSSRFADSAAFADALQPFTLAARPQREPSPARVSIPQPPFDVADEALPHALEAKLLAGMDASKAWALLAEALDEVKSARAKLIRAQLLLSEDVAPEVRARAAEDERAVLPMPGVTPTSALEALAFEWKWGYVRTLEVTPVGGKDVGPAEQEVRTQAAVGLLQHPSLRFVQEVRLWGKPGHAKAWLEERGRVC
jgi:hypothetical protein